MIAENNIFNIRADKRNNWIGQIGVRRGFCVFDTKEHGIRACFKLLCNYMRRGYNTPRKIITRFAPPTENNTESYIMFVCDKFNLEPDKVLSSYEDLFSLMKRMAEMETGTSLTLSDISKSSMSYPGENLLFDKIKV